MPSVRSCRSAGLGCCPIQRASDLRGGLAAVEFDDLPFTPRRFFSVFGVPSTHVRGEHAHRVCHQALLCLDGSMSVVVDDGTARQEVVLDDPGVALYVPPMVWATQYRFSANAVLGVLASHPYDAADYIRDYGDYLRERGLRRCLTCPSSCPSSRKARPSSPCSARMTAAVSAPHEILVVYDFDEDPTVPVIERLAAELPTIRGLRNDIGRGVLNAMKAGYRRLERRVRAHLDVGRLGRAARRRPDGRPGP